MQRTNIYLATEQARALDRIATSEGTSRAEVIRRLLDRGLRGGGDDRDVDLAAIATSAGALSDVQAVDRGSDGRSEHLDRMWRLTGSDEVTQQ